MGARAKPFIDTVIYRGGDALAAWLYTALAALGLAPRALALSAIPAAGLSLAVALWLARREQHGELSVPAPGCLLRFTSGCGADRSM